MVVAPRNIDLGHAVGGGAGCSRGHGGRGVLGGVFADWETHGVSWRKMRRTRRGGWSNRQQKRVSSLLAAFEYNNRRQSQKEKKYGRRPR